MLTMTVFWGIVGGNEAYAASKKRAKARTSATSKKKKTVQPVGTFGDLKLMPDGTATGKSDYGRMKGTWGPSDGCIAVYLHTVGGDGPNLGYVIINGTAYQAEENFENGMDYKLTYNPSTEKVTRTCLKSEYGDPYPPMEYALSELSELSGDEWCNNGWSTVKGPHVIGETEEPTEERYIYKTYFLGDGTAMYDYGSGGSFQPRNGYMLVDVCIPHASGYYYGGVIVDGYMYGNGELGGSIKEYEPNSRCIITESDEKIPINDLPKLKVNWK